MRHTNTNAAVARLAVANLHKSIAERAAAHRLSIMGLARHSGVSYWRLIAGQPLRDDELAAIEATLEAAAR